MNERLTASLSTAETTGPCAHLTSLIHKRNLNLRGHIARHLGNGKWFIQHLHYDITKLIEIARLVFSGNITLFII
jgi:hypothetical protein